MYTIQILVLFSLYFWQFWGSDHRASFMQGRHSTTEQYPQPLNISFQCFFFFFFKSLPDYLLPAPNDSNWPRKEWGLPGHQHIGTEPLDPAWDSIASTCLTYFGKPAWFYYWYMKVLPQQQISKFRCFSGWTLSDLCPEDKEGIGGHLAFLFTNLHDRVDIL
jgi:hypothetical protein